MKSEPLEYFLKKYGDLIYDLCAELLPNSYHTQVAFRTISKKTRSESKSQKYSTHEQGWVLRIVCNQLLGLIRQYGPELANQEQSHLDANETSAMKLKKFHSFFNRLPPEDRLVLLMKEKHHLSESDISTAMKIPQGSLTLRHQLALSVLVERIWSQIGPERAKGLHLIQTTLAAQPKKELPEALKNAPLSAVLPNTETARIARSHWEHLPWTVRTVLEALGIVLVVSILVTSGPKIRGLYEKKVEKNLNEIKETLQVGDMGDLNSDHLRTALSPSETDSTQLPKMPDQLSSIRAGVIPKAGEDELDGEDEDVQGKTVRVGKSQLWRFTLKTVSPDELRPLVVKALMDLKVAKNQDALRGVQVPGGIEFDLVLAQSIVPKIKHALEKLAPRTKTPNGTEIQDSFSWYKVKSKRKIPEGKSQVVIWLSQPTQLE